MQVTAGMGATGETYIVGKDRLMRSDSRFSKTSTILKTRIDTMTATRALNGESGIAVADDYRGVRVLSAFQPFGFRGVDWAILAEIDVAETELPVAELRNSVVFISLGLMLLVAFSGTILARSITTPLAQLSRSIREFRETHQPVDLSGFSGNDEISEIAQGFQATSTEISEYIASINHAHEELKRGEHDIREREERMRSLIDLSPIGFILTRFGGEILITNKTFRDILGWDEDTARTPDAAGIYQNPDDRRRYVEILKRDGAVSRFETVLLRTNGEPVWITLSSKVIEFGEDRAIMAWIDDVTERKKAEREIAAKEALLRLSFDTMADGIYVLDENLNYLLFNQRYLDLVDLPPGSVAIGEPVEPAIRAHAVRGDYGHGDTEELIRKRLAVLRSPEDTSGHLSIDGGRRELDLRKASIDGGGAVVVATDVTASQRAMAALDAERARIDAIMQSVPDAVITIGIDGTIQEVNQSVERIFGYTPEEIVGENVKILMPEDTARVHDGYVKSYVDTGKAKFIGMGPRELTAVTKSGNAIPIELSLGEAAIGADRIFIGVARDISERKIAERQLKNALETAQIALDDINAVIGSIDYGVCFMDSELRARVINHAFQDMWGIDQALIDSGPTMAELMFAIRGSGVYAVSEEYFDAYVAGRVAAVRDGAIPPTELNRADGTVLIYQCIALPDGGRMLTYYDISERKKAEDQLKQAYAVISDSIQYAAHIQRAVLTGEDLMAATMASHLVLWEPRDQVGGDIYWCYIWGDGVLVIMADCTGHGVPGAFMTLISTGALDRAMSEVPPGHVGALIQRMHQIVQITLNQHGGKGVNDDGLELGVCYIDPDITEITFAGVRTSLFIVENGEVAELKATKKGIGYRGIPQTQTFEETKIKIAAGQTFYMTTDGYIDQVGGEARRMFGKNRFRELLTSLSGMPLDQQKERLREAFVAYQGDENRRDDVSIVAFQPI